MIRAVEKVLGARIERKHLPGFDYQPHVLDRPTQPTRPVRAQVPHTSRDRHYARNHSMRTAEGRSI